MGRTRKEIVYAFAILGIVGLVVAGKRSIGPSCARPSFVSLPLVKAVANIR
jgi:hypothetical protein